MSVKFTWSYSAVKDFETCPRQYEAKRILKLYPFEETASIRFGKDLHKAIEMFGKHGTPIPKRFEFAAAAVNAVNAIPGTQYWEKQLALNEAFAPCSYFDKQVWWRGQVDFMVLNSGATVAHVIDWKSGSSKYADTAQLELMAMGVFRTFPKVRKVKAGLLFLQEGVFVPEAYTADLEEDYWKKWLAKLRVMDEAYTSGVFNPKPSGLCRAHCPVTTCPHNGNYKG